MHRLTNVYFDFDDGVNECGIAVRFDDVARGQAEPELNSSTIRHAIAMRDHDPQTVANGLRCLADWIEWKFVRTRNINNDLQQL